jgi:CubicO group peptidase (beta-lactamase class C family)
MKTGNVKLLLLVLALSAVTATAQRSSSTTWDSYVRDFDNYVSRNEIVGAATLLVRDGHIVSHHEAGMGDVALKQPVDENTIFHYGSITKTLTAITILQLRDRGKLSLDDPVTRYIPELGRVNNPYGSSEVLTVRMLLNHSSGLQNRTWPWRKDLSWEPFEPTSWEQLVAMLPYQQLAFKPGSKFSYSNPAFIYAARIVETVTGEPWLTYVQKNVFAPLEMTRSYFSTTPYHLAQYRSNNYTIQRDEAGKIERLTNGRDFDPGITNSNGGWNAPLADVAKYLAFLTNAGSEKERLYETVLKRSSLEEMLKPTIATTESTPEKSEQVGIAFFLLTRKGVTFVGHTGSQNGFTAFMYFNPAKHTGVVAAFNTFNEVRPERSVEFKALYETALELLR